MATKTDQKFPLVSVIIPAFNAEEIIERTIQSVLSQTYSHLEILIIDDGSTDGTHNVVSTLAAGDSRIRLLQQVNQGVAAARNMGIRQAKGDYIAPLDADDIWFAEKLEKQVAVLQTGTPAVGLVYTWSVNIYEDGRPQRFSTGWKEEGTVYIPLLLGNFLSNASNPLIRRECFDHVGLYNSEFLQQGAQGCEDWDLYLRIAEKYEFRVVPEHLTGYWQSEETMSSNWKQMERSYRLLMQWEIERHPEIPAYVFRWSKSNYLLYLATKAGRSMQSMDAISLLLKAVALDPYMLTNRRLQRMLAKNLIRLMSGARISPPEKSKITGPIHNSSTDNESTKNPPAAGVFWTRKMKQRTHKLSQLQQELELDTSTNCSSSGAFDKAQS